MAVQPKPALLRPCLCGRHSAHRKHSSQSRTAAPHPAADCGSQQLPPEPQEVRVTTLPHFTEHSPLSQRRPLTIEQHAKYLGVTISSDGSSHKDVLTRVAKARKHFNSLHQFWRNTDLTLKWKLRIYNAVFIPLVTYGLESAALTKGDLNRLEAFHSQSLRKILHFKSTYYTEVLNPTARTYTNQEVRTLTSQPPLTHHTHKAQLKLFGHILRSHPNSIERNCCFTSAFQYRGGMVGAGLRPGRRRGQWTEQCTTILWHWLLKSPRPPATRSPTFPYSYLQAHRAAVDRHFWSTLVRLPTCKTLLEAHSYTVFSQP